MTHPSLQAALSQHASLRPLIEKYPVQSPSLCQTLLDLTHASKWTDLQLIDMQEVLNTSSTTTTAAEQLSDNVGQALIYGMRPEARGPEAVWTCSIADMLQTAQFKTIFACLDDLDFEIKADGERPRTLLKDHFLLAVHSPDATVVYYNIARGLVKPIN